MFPERKNSIAMSSKNYKYLKRSKQSSKRISVLSPIPTMPTGSYIRKGDNECFIILILS